MMRFLPALLLALLSTPAFAHKPSDSYLKLALKGSTVQGQWDIALRDLDYALGLYADGDGAITWGELRLRHQEIAAYALSRLTIKADGGTCAHEVREHLVDHHTDGAYAVLRFDALCPKTLEPLEPWSISYRLFFDLDPQHKGLLNLSQGGQTYTAIFSPKQDTQRIEALGFSRTQQFIAYGWEGIWHIWIGYDHILFLLSLLLPAVLKREGNRWRALASFREASIDVVKIVTAFTVAHSITLSLAGLEVIALPSRWVESAIAASVVLAALNNLYPLVYGRRWVVAFVFGLVHGLGFANVLTDLGLPKGSLLLSLVGFNLGVEVGQLAIVSVFLPLAYRVRHSWSYQGMTLRLGSALIALVACV
ncbi:MAG: HupE/UreJ family protein, partial [Gammaproteobacteria bacterium]